MGRIAVVAAALFLLGACGGSGGNGGSDGVGAGASTTTAKAGDGGAAGGSTTTAAGGGLAGVSPSSTARSGGAAGGATTTSVASGEGVYRTPDLADPKNNRPLEARITPSCVEHGATVTFEIRYVVGGTVSAHAKFANDQFTDLPSSSGKVPSSGVYEWKLRVPSDAGEGRAVLSVAATGPDDGHASGQFNFKVAAPGGC